jgi:xanthine dehydrogenase large subunit
MSKNAPHESAKKHTTGEAIYIDDMVEPKGTLHAYLGLSEIAHGEIKKLDLSAVKNAKGVLSILTYKDIIGANDVGPMALNDDPVFAEKTIEFHGQPIFAVLAKTRLEAKKAARLVKIKYKKTSAKIDIATALEEGGEQVAHSLLLQRDNVEAALENSPNRLDGSMQIGGQDHFYLEGQIAFAIPNEDDEITIYSSTQHPSEVQHMVAHVLDISSNVITVKTRRVGGAFGGKETQSNLFAVVAALAAKKTGRAVKLRPDREDDMKATGKRHDFLIDYDVAYENDGQITALDATFAARCGFSADLSGPVTDRALFHADNCYYYPSVRLQSKPLKTNTVSNTAFRGFGGPQGMLLGERVIEEIAYALKKDPLEIRKKNFYGIDKHNITPYHQIIKDNIIARLVDELEASSNYQKRRKEIIKFNKENEYTRKGIALTPVKFGISFTATWYNQAGALIHIYRDGSIQLNHGGIEMGQGLYTKLASIVAEAFGVDLSEVKITATTTDKVPNTSATAASSGTDLNAMAALDAVNKIKKRLVDFAIKKFNCTKEQISFVNDEVHIGDKILSFAKFINMAYLARVQLSDTGFYKTPDIHWDREKGKGSPFFYFAYGASVSQISIDMLTGVSKVERVDILHDVGNSLNEALDIGQIEGGFIQGMGWLTSEELAWDEQGKLSTFSPSTYKIPLASDVPEIFNVKLAHWSKNPVNTIKRSKAVGEPPLMLANSVLEAISMAVASVTDYKICPRLNTPATPENILMSVERLKNEAQD